MVPSPRNPFLDDDASDTTNLDSILFPSKMSMPGNDDLLEALVKFGETESQQLMPPPPRPHRPSSSLGSSMTPGTPMTIPPSPSSPSKRPRKRARMDHGDRFVPPRPSFEESQRVFQQAEEPSSLVRTHKIIPHESDAAREQANTTFATMLSTEIEEPRYHSSSRPSSPTRMGSVPVVPTTPRRKQVLSLYSPSKTGGATPRNPGQDDPSASAYMDTPVRKETKEYLEAPQKPLRTVPKTPYRVLDAPDLTDDFYLNLVDWSSTNILGVGLGSCVYLWSAQTAEVTKLCDLGAHDHITSLSWVQKGNYLSVGTFQGHIQVWDTKVCQRIRDYPNAHTSRVGALAWHQSTITSGSRDRGIQHRDTRVPDKSPYEDHMVHKQEVCGLKWNSGINQLASGGNDNKLLVWDHRGGSGNKGKGPLWKFHEHSAAVKAIAWSPHNPGVLVSGGGTQDKKMRFWNTHLGSLLAEVDTGSQVCNLVWSKNSQELVSTHGYSSTSGQNQICIWSYPSMDMVATLSGHTHRVLYLAMSPDGQTIVTGAGDETLRFWNAFPKAKEAVGAGSGQGILAGIGVGDGVVR